MHWAADCLLSLAHHIPSEELPNVSIQEGNPTVVIGVTCAPLRAKIAMRDYRGQRSQLAALPTLHKAVDDAKILGIGHSVSRLAKWSLSSWIYNKLWVSSERSRRALLAQRWTCPDCNFATVDRHCRSGGAIMHT